VRVEDKERLDGPALAPRADMAAEATVEPPPMSLRRKDELKPGEAGTDCEGNDWADIAGVAGAVIDNIECGATRLRLDPCCGLC
jgi:hypothetical protein